MEATSGILPLREHKAHVEEIGSALLSHPQGAALFERLLTEIGAGVCKLDLHALSKAGHQAVKIIAAFLPSAKRLLEDGNFEKAVLLGREANFHLVRALEGDVDYDRVCLEFYERVKGILSPAHCPRCHAISA